MDEGIYSIVVELGENTALLIALTFLNSFAHRKLAGFTLESRSILLGFLFGAIAIIGMQIPVTITEGVIIDGRTVIVMLAGVFGGWITGVVSALCVLLYRLYLGGIGTGAGIGAILTAMAVGIAFAMHWQIRPARIRVVHLLAMSAVMSVCSLAWVFALPKGIDPVPILERLLLPVLIVYPALSVFLGSLLAHEYRRMALVADLNIALEELKKASIAKARFFSAVSHEFRTPLNAIIGFSDLMLNDVYGRITGTKFEGTVREIHSSGENLLHLVDNVMDYALIEMDKEKLTFSDVDFERLADESVSPFLEEATLRGVRLDCQLGASLPEMRLDVQAIRNALANLLSNALKHTNEGGEILLEIQAAQQDDAHKVVLSVKDNGPGIPAEMIEGLTDPFYQGLQDPHLAKEGTGLGLSIVKAIVKAHEGDLRIESEMGIGTEVTISI